MKRYFNAGFIILAILVFSLAIAVEITDDTPSGYTSHYRLRMYSQGARPGADSVNQNLKDIDSAIYARDLRIDSAKNAISWMFNYPSGTWKRYDNTEFDDDTLKTKPGVFAKLNAINNFAGLNTFSGGEIRLDNTGPGGSILNFIYDNDIGGVFIRKNSSTDLLIFDEGDGLYWQFKYPITVAGDVDITGVYKVNGVPIDAGDTTSYVSLYGSETVNGVKHFSNASNSYLGDASGLINIPASSVVGRIDNANLPLTAFTTSNLDTSKVVFNDQRDTLKGKRVFADSVLFRGKVRFNSTVLTADTVLLNGTTNVEHGTFGLLDGAELVVGTLTNLLGQSTLAYLEVPQTLSVTGYVISDLLFQKGSPANFGTQDNFGLGFITNNATRMRLDSLGNLRLYGFFNDRKDTTIVRKLNGVGTYTYLRHGITNWRNISEIKIVVWEDSLARWLPAGYNITAGTTVGSSFFANDTAVNFFTPSGSHNLGPNANPSGSNDSIKVTIVRKRP